MSCASQKKSFVALKNKAAEELGASFIKLQWLRIKLQNEQESTKPGEPGLTAVRYLSCKRTT